MFWRRNPHLFQTVLGRPGIALTLAGLALAAREIHEQILLVPDFSALPMSDLLLRSVKIAGYALLGALARMPGQFFSAPREERRRGDFEKDSGLAQPSPSASPGGGDKPCSDALPASQPGAPDGPRGE